MSRTKIVCTIGPASRSPRVLRELIEAGMNVARLNFSHGDHAQHAESIRRIREAAEALGRPVAILQDLSGPKIRVGALDGDAVTLADGDRFVLTTRPVPGTREAVSVNYPDLPRDLAPGALLLLADGALELEVLETTDTDIVCRVVVGGVLGANKGVNSPTSSLNIPCLTGKDRHDLAFGLAQGVDLVALSFVREAADIREVRREIEASGRTVPVVAKIEKHEAVGHAEDIVREADAVMVARGDLGLEIPLERVPVVQKRIIASANAAARPVITATQMLGSMVAHPRPTRAEAADVSNAVLDGTDAIMLSEETAVGAYPVRAVRTLRRICDETEAEFPHADWARRHADAAAESVPEAVSHAACGMARRLDVPLILVYSHAGATARTVARFRPRARILVVTPQPETYRQLGLVWGVVPVLTDRFLHTEQVVDLAHQVAAESGCIRSGERFIIVGGVPVVGVTGGPNAITVTTLP